MIGRYMGNVHLVSRVAYITAYTLPRLPTLTYPAPHTLTYPILTTLPYPATPVSPFQPLPILGTQAGRMALDRVCSLSSEFAKMQ